ALGEPVVNLGEHRACSIATVGVAEESRETGRSTQLQGSGSDLAGLCDYRAEISFGFCRLPNLIPQFPPNLEGVAGPRTLHWVRFQCLFNRHKGICDCAIKRF